MKTSLYIDTQVVNYLRKSSFENINLLLDLIRNRSVVYDLYYSAAHLGDYLRDSTDHKNYDLNFMNEIGINNYLSYNDQIRASVVVKRAPIDAFYNGRMDKEEYDHNYNENTKPKIDNILEGLLDWYKPMLIEFENNSLSINTLDSKSIEVFNALSKQVGVNSRDLTFDSFVNKMDEYWEDNIETMPDKEANKYVLSVRYLEENLVSYSNQTFDLSQSNLVEQVNNTQFQKDFMRHMEEAMFSMSMNYTSNFDQLSFFNFAYGFLQMSAIEKDKVKKFNIRSSVNDAGHFTMPHIVTF